MQSQLGALRLSHCSISAHHSQTQEQLHEVQVQRDDLHLQCTQLQNTYGQLYALYLQSQGATIDAEGRFVELCHAYEASESLVAQQAVELQQQTMELEAANAAANELGEMMTAVVSADVFATEAFESGMKVADIFLRNKHQELEIARLKDELSGIKESEEPNGTTPVLDFGDTSSQTIGASCAPYPITNH